MNNRGRKGALLVSIGTLRLDDGAVMFLRQSWVRWKRLWEKNQIRSQPSDHQQELRISTQDTRVVLLFSR